MFNVIVNEMLNGNKIAFMVTSCPTKIDFSSIEELCPNKVMKFTFKNGTSIKTICSAEDTFSLQDAFYIALAKYLNNNNLTPEGVSKFAEELKCYKAANKIVNRGMRLYKRQIQDKERIKAELAEEKAATARKREKKIRYKKRREERLAKKIANEIKKSTV